jgi:UPF0755 protein
VIRALGVLAIAGLLLGGSVWLAITLYDSAGPLKDSRVVVVPRGSIDQIADLLHTEGVVGNPTTLRLAAAMTRSQGALRSAELSFPPGASIRIVLLILRAGKPVQHRLTIPEGLTAAQVALLLERAPAMEGSAPVPEEGSLLPETYSYELGFSRAALQERAKKAMDRALDQAWASRTVDTAVLKTPRDALILASIVERETSKPDERPRVAAVFLNRLKRGMRLQSDPTVVYGASGGLGVLDHGITRAELDRDDPYNTYKINGLPPGPIAMPGAATLKAVTQPWATEELYFVADGSGGHVFARTDPEHQRNVARWREFERQRAAPSVKPVN